MDSNCVYFEIKNQKLAEILKKTKVDLSVFGDIVYSNSADCNFARWLEIADEGDVKENVARYNIAEWIVSFLSWMGNVYCGGFTTLSDKNVKKAQEKIEEYAQEINYSSNDGFIIKLCWCSPNGGANDFEVYHFEDGKMNAKRFNEYEYQELFPNDDRPFWQVMAEEGLEEMDRIFGCDNIKLNTGNKKSTSTQQNDIDDRFDQIDDIEFEGKLFCFTGFEHSGRDLIGKNETVDSMMNFGGDIRSDVSSKVDYLVIDNYFGGKYDKAKELQQKGGKIKIISRDAFEKIVHIKLSNQTKKLKGKESKAENQLYKYKKQANGTIKIVEYKGNEETITVPSHIENLPVTIIGEFAFSSIREYIHGGLFTSESYRDPLIAKQMILPDTIEKIESKAIKCNKLEEINIPTKITAVSNEMLPAFKRKGEGVENARIHLTENVTSITGKPFGTELYPRACTIIAPKGSYAETYAKRHSIDFEVEKQKNESNVVSDNVSTLKSEKEENHLKKPQNASTPIIEQNITSKDKSISELSGLNNTTYAQQEIASKYFVIENGVLKKYTGYGAEVVIPDGVTVIGKKAFKSNSMRKVVMPESVIEIGDSAFYGCLYLEEVQLSPKLQTIDKYAFYLCKFKSIEIPSSVKVIGDQAFCFDLKNITLLCESAKISGTAFNWDAKFSGPQKLYDRLLEENASFKYSKKRWKNIEVASSEKVSDLKTINAESKSRKKSVVNDMSTSSNTITTAITAEDRDDYKSILKTAPIGLSPLENVKKLSLQTLEQIYRRLGDRSRYYQGTNGLFEIRISKFDYELLEQDSLFKKYAEKAENYASSAISQLKNPYFKNSAVRTASFENAVIFQWEDIVSVIELAYFINMYDLPSFTMELYLAESEYDKPFCFTITNKDEYFKIKTKRV